jgi:hypothetical protein
MITYELIKVIGWEPVTRDHIEISIEKSSSLSYIQETMDRLEKSLPNNSGVRFYIKTHTQESSPYGDWRDIYG